MSVEIKAKLRSENLYFVLKSDPMLKIFEN